MREVGVEETRVTHDDEAPPPPDDPLRADTLHPATVEEIERLRSAVLNAEAEQRFSVGRGRKSDLLLAAEEAERIFLNAHDFATYNDYRLRIRRSIALPATQAVANEDPRPDAEGSEPGDASGSAATGPDVASELAQDPAVCQSVVDPRPQEDLTPADSSGGDLWALVRRFEDDVTTGVDALVTARLSEAEMQAADVLARASTQAEEISTQVARLRAAAQSAADATARHLETLLTLTESVPTEIERVRGKL